MRETESLYFASLLVTDINTQNSLFLIKGGAEFLERITYQHVEHGELFDMPGIVSRKKQVIPYLTGLIKEMAADGALPQSAPPFTKKKK